MDIRKLGTTLYHLVQTVQDPTPPYQKWCLLKDINGNQQPYVKAEELTVATRDEQRSFEQQLGSKAGVIERPTASISADEDILRNNQRVFLNGELTTNSYCRGDEGINDLKTVILVNKSGRIVDTDGPVQGAPRLYCVKLDNPDQGKFAVEVPKHQISLSPVSIPAVVAETPRLGQPAAVERPSRFGQPAALPRYEKPAALERPSRFGQAAALERPSRFGQPVAVQRPSRVYPTKACTFLPKRIFHKFELMGLSARSHGGIAGMIPGVRWEFIGYCVETDSESLDLFQFDAAGKSAFQDNFFNHYDTLVSYCFEGGKHYACFTPMSQEIIDFVAWLIAQEQVVKSKLKEYMSYAEIEEYRHFVEVAERAKRMPKLVEQERMAEVRVHQLREQQLREQQLRYQQKDEERARIGLEQARYSHTLRAEELRGEQARVDRLRASERAVQARMEQRRSEEAREAERLQIIAEQTRAEQERIQQAEFVRVTEDARRRAVESTERFGAESRAMDQARRRREQQELNAALLYEAREAPVRRYGVVPEMAAARAPRFGEIPAFVERPSEERSHTMAAAREVPLYGAPVRRQMEPVRRQLEPVQDFSSMETVNAARRALGYPEFPYELTSEQECWLAHYMNTGQRPESAVDPVCGLKMKSRRQ